MMNYESLEAYSFQKSDISYLEELLLDDDANLKVLPYADLADVPQQHLTQFCVEFGFYSIPTMELIDFLKEEIGERSAIEIASGNGVYGKALNIKCTDNFMQLAPQIRQHYELMRQALVPYGEHVENLDGLSAVKKYRPDVVVAAWCTHKFDPAQAWRKGNMYGVEEKSLIRKVKKYIHIGNEHVHSQKPALSLPHRTIKEKWILSRSLFNDKNVIYVWGQ